MIALKPVLSAWLEEAEAAKRDPDRCGEKKYFCSGRLGRAARMTRRLDYFFYIWPFTTMKISPMAQEICQSRF